LLLLVKSLFIKLKSRVSKLIFLTYNTLVREENFLRNNLNIPLVNEIHNHQDCIEARNELNNWAKYFSSCFRNEDWI